MQNHIKIIFYTVILIFLLMGCTYQRKVILLQPDLPEEIFSYSRAKISGARVGVFSFSDIPSSRGMGKLAAQFLCQELEKAGIFKFLFFHSDLNDISMDRLIEIALAEKYDLIITGKLLHYFDGSDMQAASVIEEIRVINVKWGKPEILCHAKAIEIVEPKLSTDYIIVHGKGAAAPSTMLLMQRNAKKFCNMIVGG